MKYLSSEPFVMPRPAKSTCCEACVYGSGEHADFCEFWCIPPRAITRENENTVINLNVWYDENRKAWDRQWREYCDEQFHRG